MSQKCLSLIISRAFQTVLLVGVPLRVRGMKLYHISAQTAYFCQAGWFSGNTFSVNPFQRFGFGQEGGQTKVQVENKVSNHHKIVRASQVLGSVTRGLFRCSQSREFYSMFCIWPVGAAWLAHAVWHDSIAYFRRHLLADIRHRAGTWEAKQSQAECD